MYQAKRGLTTSDVTRKTKAVTPAITIASPVTSTLEHQYKSLRVWVESSIGRYKVGLSRALYPIFVHVYFKLIEADAPESARRFFEAYKQDHTTTHRQDMLAIGSVMNATQMRSNEVCKRVAEKRMSVAMTDYTFQLLLAFLQDKAFIGLIAIVNERLRISVHGSDDEDEDEDAVRVHLGPLPRDPWLLSELDKSIKTNVS